MSHPSPVFSSNCSSLLCLPLRWLIHGSLCSCRWRTQSTLGSFTARGAGGVGLAVPVPSGVCVGQPFGGPSCLPGRHCSPRACWAWAGSVTPRLAASPCQVRPEHRSARCFQTGTPWPASLWSRNTVAIILERVGLAGESFFLDHVPCFF